MVGFPPLKLGFAENPPYPPCPLPSDQKSEGVACGLQGRPLVVRFRLQKAPLESTGGGVVWGGKGGGEPQMCALRTQFVGSADTFFILSSLLFILLKKIGGSKPPPYCQTILQRLYKFFHSPYRFRYVFDGIRVGDTRKALTARAERGAGDDRNLAFVKQSFAEFVGRQAEAAYIREDVERAFRLKARDTYAVQLFNYEFSSSVVLGSHHFDIVVAVFQRFHRGKLARRRGAHYGKLMYFEHLLRERRGRADKAETPAGHRVRL